MDNTNQTPNKQILVTENQSKLLRAIATMYGYERNFLGNMWRVVQQTGEGEYGIVKLGEIADSKALFLRLTTFFTGKHPFHLRYRNDEGNVISVVINGGYLGINAVRGYYLVGCSPNSASQEIPALQNNHLIFLNQIVEILGVTNEVFWQPLTSIKVVFVLFRPWEYCRADRDEVLSPSTLEDYAIPEGMPTENVLLIRRSISSTPLFAMDLSQYSRRYILSAAVRTWCDEWFRPI